ncbi:MAG TPA: carbonic anhydrase [Acidobacteriota bacterium]|nr:carbonic anhydrase [Acidobacteriota bacterium]
MAHHETLESFLSKEEDWIYRRQKGIPNDKQLFVLTCMDERIPVEEALDLELGDAHIFRNAGGLVTDDVIRSAALTIHFFQTREIIILNHTECGMLSASGDAISKAIEEKTGVTLSEIALDPALENFRLSGADVHKWWKMQENIDETARAQVEALRNHPLIPSDIPIHAYIFEVESGNIRRPGEIHTVKTAIPPGKR